jgi:hypothetical protein
MSVKQYSILEGGDENVHQILMKKEPPLLAALE